MKIVRTLAFAAAALIGVTAQAQYVKGNEAVQLTAAGKQVQAPPLPARPAKLCPVVNLCHAGAWHMVETAEGLLECTEPYARATTCRASTYGSQKLPRVWVVKTGSTWLWCQYPDLGSKCVEMFARPPANLPHDAVQ